MIIQKANELLRRELGSDRWYFQERGNKIVFLEELVNTYNLIYPLTLPSGHYSDSVYDFHIRQAIEFVRRRRNPKDSKRFDIKRKVFSGEKDID